VISFVLYFHSSRTDNLRQTLRVLFSRERSEKEVILVCNDRTEETFEGCRLFNLESKDYRKTAMCNLGVRESRGEVVALMDSDRILPLGYFGSTAAGLRRGEFVSCTRMLRIRNPVSDEQIEREEFEYDEEFRSKGWCLWRRNLFSGNTMFYRSDYLDAGGMDESFVGYGFADNDMTRKVVSMGFRSRWVGATELHLYHAKEALEEGNLVGEKERTQKARDNMCKFLKKWKDKEYFRRCRCIA
jgi:GT2 family glycosyltransferase